MAAMPSEDAMGTGEPAPEHFWRITENGNLHRGFFCPGDCDAQMSTKSIGCLEFLSLSQAAPQPVNHLSETVLTSPSRHIVCQYCGLLSQNSTGKCTGFPG